MCFINSFAVIFRKYPSYTIFYVYYSSLETHTVSSDLQPANISVNRGLLKIKNFNSFLKSNFLHRAIEARHYTAVKLQAKLTIYSKFTGLYIRYRCFLYAEIRLSSSARAPKCLRN